MKKGFTLTEMLVTIAVLAVLMGGTMSVIGPGSQRTSRDTQRRTDLGAISSALAMYRNDMGQYPPCSPAGAVSCTASNIPGLVTDYLESIPTDPSSTDGRFYRYQPVSSAGGTCDGSTTKCVRYTLCAGSERDTTTDNSTICAFTVAGQLCGNDSTETCVFVERNK